MEPILSQENAATPNADHAIEGWNLSECRWEEYYRETLVELGAVKMLASRGDVGGDWSGSVEVVCATSSGGLVVGWSWGSCSGCDSFEDEAPSHIRAAVRSEIKPLSAEGLKVYLADHFPKVESHPDGSGK